jgi:DNA-binding NarL/FixJ family response regulator
MVNITRAADTHRTVPVMDPETRTIKVFLCDDVQAFRALIRFALEEDESIEVVGEAADGRAGIEGVAALQPDVVLLDLSMPLCDGLEAMPAMRERSPRSRVIALSGFTAERMAAPMLEQGASAYLEKGADLEVIQATVREVAGFPGRLPAAHQPHQPRAPRVASRY